MVKHYEARFAGVGGQGVILAGKIVGHAVVNFEHGVAIQTPTYTAQVRGGATKVDVVIDKDHIEYPKAEHIDFFLSLHQKSFDLYFKEIKDNAIIIVDPNLTTHVPKGITQTVYKIELIEMAKEKLGRALYAAVIAVGIFSGLTDVIQEKNIIKAVIDNAPAGTEEKNMQAVKLGIAIAKEIKEGKLEKVKV